MGICTSCPKTSIITGKLILPNGTLLEFYHPVPVSDILHKHPFTFICNSDEMEFDEDVSPIKDDDQLQPGQLYFALPLNQLKRPLEPEDMATLAVKASAALAKFGSQENVYFTSSFSGKNRGMKGWNHVADAYTIGLSPNRFHGGSSGGGGKIRNFKAMLSVIPE